VKLDHAIDQVQQAELDLGNELEVLAERHAAEHDVYHMGHTLAQRCVEHLERLRPIAERYEARRVDSSDAMSPGPLESVRRRASEVLATSKMSGLLLLEDLRDRYLTAQRVEIEWAILLQAAKAVRDGELVAVVSSCQEEAEGTAAWLRTRIKTGAAQVLATS
jgi:hypothetical protein